jgi:hypothetical protein
MALTNKDKQDIGVIVGKAIAQNNEVLFDHFASKQDLVDLKEELSDQAKKTERRVLQHIDSFAGEAKASRDERTVQSHQIIRNTKRIEKLESAVFPS